ncbi:hypothetical protein [Microbulbifer sp. JMSA003]|uniref:hypothetical protein n=1 Tax=Microbulbifer sp. JMSA003 TaxID=3243369 RepID=UPI00403A6584
MKNLLVAIIFLISIDSSACVAVVGRGEVKVTGTLSNVEFGGNKVLILTPEVTTAVLGYGHIESYPVISSSELSEYVGKRSDFHGELKDEEGTVVFVYRRHFQY